MTMAAIWDCNLDEKLDCPWVYNNMPGVRRIRTAFR